MDNVADSLCRLEYGGSEAYRPRCYAECFCGHIRREEADVRLERVETGLVQGGSETAAVIAGNLEVPASWSGWYHTAPRDFDRAHCLTASCRWCGCPN